MTEKQATAAFHYRDLSPELILDAIESLAIYPETGLTPLNSYENRVYQFRCDRGQRYVVKFYRPERWTDAQIVEEHEFTFELAEARSPLPPLWCSTAAVCITSKSGVLRCFLP